MTAADDFERLVRAEDACLDLGRASLALARTRYGDLDPALYLARLDELAADAGARPAAQPRDALSNLAAVLFGAFGLEGNTGSYYDPRNSYLNEVLDRRLGIPISISLVYLEVGWRLGLALRPVSFPGHFLVCLEAQGELLVVDPFNGGEPVSNEALVARLARAVGTERDARRLLPTALRPCPRREVLARTLRNLDAIYTRAEDVEGALTVADLAVRLEPVNAAALRKRGLLYAKIGHRPAAVADLERYLALMRDQGSHDDAAGRAVRALLAELRAGAAPLS